MITKPVLVKGHQLRDEFSCPITRELMRDPVIAADGHTYDREAIEMWLRSHNTSPRTGQLMDHLILVPNHNLKRLIKDLISEGGEGLYYKEEGIDYGPDAPYRHALVPEHVLILKCLGPVESDWNGKSYMVSEKGCIGGRRMPTELRGADFMHFSDVTVSRKHFEIFFDRSEKIFKIKDEGSAGGTFIRIPYGISKPLFPSLMIMLGKHQLLVTEPSKGERKASSNRSSSRDDTEGNNQNDDNRSEGNNGDVNDSCGPGTPVYPSVSNKEALIESNIAALNLHERINEENMDVIRGEADDDSASETSASPTMDCDENHEEKWNFGGAYESEIKQSRGHRSLQLECFAPEGTPIQGRQYSVGREGTTLGRKQNNTIAFSHMVQNQLMGIDSSISGEHARIEYSAQYDCLFLLDGTPSKPSTNGTWFRLSQMHNTSEPHPLHENIEILIGTVRFSAGHEMMVVEKEILSPEDLARYTTDY
mmetsp:Transcript_14072/g.20798  ORF Transcript_14072/g.20798 Transcript_14072/m.20798 type:complete len:478 (+) Transcript_14072:189-1622(+)|eukprot:CAMPEP_0171462158 /NCGR_PEP_ID=MMETSP0945-20130129/6311_1 /TAXON_ID=109269 /ORGANISM="Vaucheria litorea, Strain CCMP2940" /LENGTH=477 /DNA_ID=CAMNT_0011988635 /DNA_START=181 /DNA_END=1614 /DNA_ORIENTATION=+